MARLIQVKVPRGVRRDKGLREKQEGNTMKHLAFAALSALALSTPMALAQSAGDITVGIGVGTVDPTSGNGTLAGQPTDVDSGTAVVFTAEYFIKDNLGIELLAATPFNHSATISGVGTVATKQLPPTLSLNYHFANDSKWTPYVGVGVNYTTFFEENSALGNVALDDSFGLAAQVGVDYALSDKDAVRATLRYIDIDTDARLNGAPIGTANIDPLVYSFSYVRKF